MTYEVILQPQAEAEIEAAYLYYRDIAPDVAARWLDGMDEAIDTLARLPTRCPLAPEAREFDLKVRQLLVGRRRSTYRVLFVIQDKQVRVLHVRHAARRPMTRDELRPE